MKLVTVLVGIEPDGKAATLFISTGRLSSGLNLGLMKKVHAERCKR